MEKQEFLVLVAVLYTFRNILIYLCAPEGSAHVPVKEFFRSYPIKGN